MTMRQLFPLILALFAAPVAAQDLCPLVAQLNREIVARTGYTRPAPCPEIGFSVLPAGGALRSQAGAFFPDTGRIELAPDLDLTTALGQSFLLHELVHAAQYMAGAERRVRCPAALEAEAYRVQADFLRDQGLGRDALMTGMLADHLGSCGAAMDY